MRSRNLLGGLLTGAVILAIYADVLAQKHYVFKVKTPYQSGRAEPDSARMNDYYVNIGYEDDPKTGSRDGLQIGTELNVYREKEIEAEFGNLKFRQTLFIGRVKAYDVQAKYTICRVVELASYSDPHRERNAVMLGDHVQPVFVVESENLFAQGSSDLMPEAISELVRAANFIRRYMSRGGKVRIEGHTDSSGDEAANLDLSERRAKMVRDYLVNEAKFDAALFITVGYGEAKPIASNDTPEGRRKNRRFEIVIER